jgi:hypothetical protein
MLMKPKHKSTSPASKATPAAKVSLRQIEQEVPSAMLPDSSVDASAVPEAPSLASLTARARLGTARAMLALGKPAEAEQQHRAVRAYLANWPATAKDRETMYVVDSWARLAEAAFAKKDYDGAFKLLMSGAGWPWRLPEELERQKRALSDKVVEARKQGSEGDLRARQQLSPNEKADSSAAIRHRAAGETA